MTAADLLSIARARRSLRRASRLLRQDRPAEAVTLARAASKLLQGHAERDWRRRSEYLAALVLLCELNLARCALVEAVAVQDELVATLEQTPCPGDTFEQAADRLADALIRRGDTLRLLSEYPAATTDLERALGLATSLLQRAGAHNARGILAKDIGRLDDAASHYAHARIGLEAVLGADHPTLASIHHNLAGLEHARGNYREGEPHARRAIELRSRLAGANSPEVAADLAVLGALLAGQGRVDEAEAVFRQTLKTWIGHRGPDHYEVAVSLHHLGALHAAQGDLEAAGRELGDALRIKQAVLGVAHPETRTLAGDLARVAQG